jgi:hypothetical protein
MRNLLLLFTLSSVCLMAIIGSTNALALEGPLWIDQFKNPYGVKQNIEATGVGAVKLVDALATIQCAKLAAPLAGATNAMLPGSPGQSELNNLTLSECALEGKTVAQCGAQSLKPFKGAAAGILEIPVRAVLAYEEGKAGSKEPSALDAFVAVGESSTPNLLVEYELHGTACGGVLNKAKIKVVAEGTEITDPPLKRRCGFLAELGKINAGTFESTKGEEVFKEVGLAAPEVSITHAELFHPEAKKFTTISCNASSGTFGSTRVVAIAKIEAEGKEAFGWDNQ